MEITEFKAFMISIAKAAGDDIKLFAEQKERDWKILFNRFGANGKTLEWADTWVAFKKNRTSAGV